MKKLKPWARGPLELIQHAEEHLRGDSDFDRRMVLVSFDNAIELSIITFLSLNPIQRSGLQYEKAQVGKWMHNFHSKLEFLEYYVVSQLKQEMLIERDVLVYYHSIRNELYHNGNGFAPALEIVDGIKSAAHWVFSVLFESKPEDHFVSRVVESKSPFPTDETGLSSATLFLKAFIDVKNLLNSEMGADGVEHSSSLVSAIRKFAENYPIKLPDGLVAAAVKAEEVREVMLGGEQPDLSGVELKNLSSELKKYSAQIDSKLRLYQLKLVEAAVEATVKTLSLHEDRKVGVVHQTLGTGINMSIVSYIIRARQIAGLEYVPFIVVGTHRELLSQLQGRLIDHCPGSSGMHTVMPMGKVNLMASLSAPNPGVIFTTMAQLRNIPMVFEQKCLLIGVGLQGVQFDFKRSTPLAALINFSSSPVGLKEFPDKNFGSLVVSFGLQQAVEHGVLLPLILDKRPVTVVARAGADESAVSDGVREEWIIGEVCKDLKSFSFDSRCKAIIVTNRISVASILYEKLVVALGGKGESGVAPLTVGLLSSAEKDGGRHAVQQFNNASDGGSVLVITSGMLAGLDLPEVNMAFVTSPLQTESLEKITTLLGRAGRSTEGVIVDFSGNAWPDVMIGQVTKNEN
ncbi:MULTISPECIES: hypothetical protein [unclassified Pseudomonas]|uniref:hypothetical protein n=1 Tax=unclassified Pseudomonas TaxID=196821 RepID=UPI001CBC8BAE|nr:MULTISPECIES: hypothetical protein [unclassified Pseudomonas]